MKQLRIKEQPAVIRSKKCPGNGIKLQLLLLWIMFSSHFSALWLPGCCHYSAMWQRPHRWDICWLPIVARNTHGWLAAIAKIGSQKCWFWITPGFFFQLFLFHYHWWLSLSSIVLLLQTFLSDSYYCNLLYCPSCYCLLPSFSPAMMHNYLFCWMIVLAICCAGTCCHLYCCHWFFSFFGNIFLTILVIIVIVYSPESNQVSSIPAGQYSILWQTRFLNWPNNAGFGNSQ